MRLTLRTLLAWLDDKLPPSEVREIGKQVAESPFAQELVERIQRVTRQRRLTVPTSTGSDATDPNLVASYIDNELDQDLVPEYEKLCLTSDVHMAEVVSVHQILSLFGQKAKVPTEAKNRMYHLIRGREAIDPKQRPIQPEPAAPVSEPIQPWVTPPPPSRPWIERFGPATAAVLLLCLLVWSAWMSLNPPPSTTPELAVASAVKPNDAAHAGENAPASRKPGEPSPAADSLPEDPGDLAAVAKAEISPENPGGGANKEAAPKIDLPSGIIGMTEKPQGVLLRYSTERPEWVQLDEPAPLKPKDHLLSLDPFRSTLDVGSARVDLVSETDVWLGSPGPNEAARFQLGQGRVTLRGTSPAQPFAVQFAGKDILVTPPSSSAVGVERINRFESGNPASARSVLRIYGSEGELAVEVDDAKETLTGPGSIDWDGSKWTDKSEKPPPAWVTDTKPTAFEMQVGEQFLRYMRPNRPVITNIVEAHDDDQKDVRRLSLRALRAVGDLSYITPDLNRAEDPTARREAIRVLRAAYAQGPEAVKALHDQLVRDFGPDLAATIEQLLVGYTAKEARDESTYTKLVEKLTAPDVGVRELALDNLRALTGRDELEYDPDKFEGKGLRAWRDLLRNHELRPAGPVGKAEK